MSDLKNKEIILGVTGGIACHKSLEINRGIKEAGGKVSDILKELGSEKKETQFLVGFAGESENLSDYTRKKLIEKNMDLKVTNNILEDRGHLQC